MNKTLIELMLEANVEWPEGAEFAAQDERDLYVCFYRDSPELRDGNTTWSSVNRSAVYWFALPLLSIDWDETVITRAEYEAAQDKAERDHIFGDRIDLPETFGKVSIEGKLLQRQTLRDSLHDCELQLNALNESLDVLDAEIAADLAALGWGEQSTGNAGGLEVTDWRQLKVGDTVRCVSAGASPASTTIDRVGVVLSLDFEDESMPVLVELDGGVQLWCREVELIRRPAK